MFKNDGIHVGQIWQVVTDEFMTSGQDEFRKNGGRQTKLKNGELIEIRYPYARHFRTEDDHYFHATSEMIVQNCQIYGEIWEQVRFGNKCKLEEIIRLQLFDKIKKK